MRGKAPVPMSTAAEAWVPKAEPNISSHAPSRAGVLTGRPTRRQKVREGARRRARPPAEGQGGAAEAPVRLPPLLSEGDEAGQGEQDHRRDEEVLVHEDEALDAVERERRIDGGDESREVPGVADGDDEGE